MTGGRHGQPVLSVRQLAYRYPGVNGSPAVEALVGVTFEVAEGEICSIVGKSGCGKTTLLRAIAGLLTPSRGRVILAGREVCGPSADLAVVFQDYSKSLLPWRTVRENVRLGLASFPSMSADERAERVENYLALVGLEASATKYPWQLSGGMQQRVALARALARHPRVLLLDEPFGSLDVPTRLGLEDQLLEIAEALGITVVMITHDIDEAVYMSDRVLVIARSGELDTTAHGAIGDVDIAVRLPRPRRQIETRADPEFTARRADILERLHLLSSPRDRVVAT